MTLHIMFGPFALAVNKPNPSKKKNKVNTYSLILSLSVKYLIATRKTKSLLFFSLKFEVLEKKIHKRKRKKKRKNVELISIVQNQ